MNLYKLIAKFQVIILTISSWFFKISTHVEKDKNLS